LQLNQQNSALFGDKVGIPEWQNRFAADCGTSGG
jgi:hypothetical protein